MLLEQLRTPCSADEITDNGVHKHKCECGTVWKHDGELLQNECTVDEFALAHSCPNCGNDVREKHYAEGDCRNYDTGLAKALFTLVFGREPTEEDLKAIIC